MANKLLTLGTLTAISEVEFTAAGPGAQAGIRKCFTHAGNLMDAEGVRLAQERQAECFAAAGISLSLTLLRL